MEKPTVEFDFFGMEKETASKNHLQKNRDRRSSIRNIQTAISKIHPAVLRSVMAFGSAMNGHDEIKPEVVHMFPPQNAFPRFREHRKEENILQPSILTMIDSAQTMTIFYNGTVSVFHVPPDKAEVILKLAVGGSSSGISSSKVLENGTRKTTSQWGVSRQGNNQSLVESMEGDLPIARRKSLQRFLEKRRERLVSSYSPYAFLKPEVALV